jgi:antitoxin VapB
MGLNIKSQQTEANIRKLAERTGLSLTDAIDKAVCAELRKLEQNEQSQHSLTERLKALQQAFASQRLNPADTRSAREWIDDLYDEHGLPK